MVSDSMLSAQEQPHRGVLQQPQADRTGNDASLVVKMTGFCLVGGSWVGGVHCADAPRRRKVVGAGLRMASMASKASRGGQAVGELHG